MVPLSERSEYEGGGTYVEPLGRAIALDQGCALLHPSCVRHAGHRITKGERWVLHAYSTRLVPFTLLACLYPEAPSQLLRLAISCMLSSSPHPTLAVGCSCSHPLLAYLLYLLTYFTYLLTHCSWVLVLFLNAVEMHEGEHGRRFRARSQECFVDAQL